MDTSLFRYIWRYSKYDQLRLVLLTSVTFPILFLTLELPKRIINDAIGGTGEDTVVLGVPLSQIQFLMLLCFGFLAVVLANGLIKMRLNTMKGILAERLLRRFRFQMLSRILRFPRPYFRRTSQGELVSIITSEVEPMSGLMGDLLSQPLFQAGQMLTIVAFLFAQSVWFGLAAIALIPVQAWLIPKLQRQINQLNKKRIQEVRHLASEIGETAGGVSDLRTNGGMRYQLSQYSRQLGLLFGIRLEIFKKKYFMKFLNNFLNQLTPFFFYSVGGYLAIKGDITVGALVAALAAYKDIASPWNELLAYYNQTQDMAVRWEVLTEKFIPKTLVRDDLFEGRAAELPRLNGDIELRDVTVLDEEGRPVLQDVSCVIPGGSKVAVRADSETAALAFADLLTREVIPASGKVLINGLELNNLHQDVVAHRIGYAQSNPHVFQGTLLENLMMPFKTGPVADEELSAELRQWQIEAGRAGNSIDPPGLNWINPRHAGFQSMEEVNDWWIQLSKAMGIEDLMARRALTRRIDFEQQPELARAIVELRPEIARRLKEAGLDDIVCRFDPDRFNPVSPLTSNLLYALPRRMLTQVSLSQEKNFLKILREQGIIDELADMSASVICDLKAAFGMDGTGHPLFRLLNLDEDLYLRLVEIADRRMEVGDAGLPAEDFALMLTVPFAFSAEQIGPAFDDSLKEKILNIRKANARQMVEQLQGLFEPIEPDRYLPVMSLLGNAIFGRISNMAGVREAHIQKVVLDVLAERGLIRDLVLSLLNLEVSRGGENLSAIFRERIALTRAGIKKPDILILGKALASYTPDARKETRDRISGLLPESTKIFIENMFYRPEQYDLYIQIENGRIDGQEAKADRMSAGLQRKLKALAKAPLFADLDQKQLNLLAFSARWYKVAAGKEIFLAGEAADAAYLCVSGSGVMVWPGEAQTATPITTVLPGRLVGDLVVILGGKRVTDLYALEDSVFLRIGAEELLTVIDNDVTVASSLLRKVAANLEESSARGRESRRYAAARGVDFSEFDRQLAPVEDLSPPD
ncbi:ABC transporter transmembrane domain-containing protein [Mangrovicoccus ximenensis]|uniref:ABC transporter transmembrane domain-containing protein n=1 Tax=Mangrovicoccus ximenensis TaxID=1911570 RepID=UPI000D332A10|nr:ABC transporter transmembrane domain-containing protein [Mangrovicoccus ximenensis]